MFNSPLNLLSTNWLLKALALVRGTLNDVDPPMNGVKAAELRPPKDGIDGIDMVGTRGAGVEVWANDKSLDRLNVFLSVKELR